jgi:hypothetical protein
MASDRDKIYKQALNRRRYKRAALTVLAVCLLVVASLSAVELILHIQRDHAHGARLWPSDDHFESGLVLCWLVCGVLTIVIANSLGTPVRQIVFACAGLMTGLALVFCFVAAAG